MWKAEEDFPRGGAKLAKVKKGVEAEDVLQRSSSKAAKKLKRSEVEESLETLALPKKQKRKLSSLEAKPTAEPKQKYLKTSSPESVEFPLSQCLEENLCLLGCVRQVQDYNISVSLPGNRVGSLPITNISKAYTTQLYALAQAEETDLLEDIKSAGELFKPGMLMAVSIKSVTEDEEKSKTQIQLSCMPSSLNAELPLQSIQDGLVLFGNVLSVEDHGYRVDLGIKGLQGFLTTKDAEKFIQENHEGAALSVGEPVWCVIKMKGKLGASGDKTRAVNVTIDPELVRDSVLSETPSLHTLVPGVRVKATVTGKASNGLHVTVFSFDAVIHISQLPRGPQTYKIGQQIDVRVLYTNPDTKVVQLTALSKIINSLGSQIKMFQDLQVGNIMEAKLLRLEKNRGVYFSLSDGVNGFAAMKQLSDDSDQLNISKYVPGQKHQCRILGFNFMEGIALITLKQSIIQQTFLSVEDLSPGDIVKAVVKDVTPNGVLVKLSKGIFSFIQCLHLADVPIKHPEKKFQHGMTLKCRVMKVDLQKSKVVLTHKKSLVKSKYPVVTDLSQLSSAMELEGYIIAVKENVAVVAFYNDVKGFVMSKDMSTEKVTDATTMFYKGQVIRCRVLHWDVAAKRLQLTLNFHGPNAGTQRKKPSTNSHVHLEVGTITEGKIASQEAGGFRVSLPGKQSAFLPFSHLSDYYEVQEMRRIGFRPGQKIERLTLFAQKQQTILTMKESILQAAEAGQLVTNFGELKIGMLLPAVIKNHEDYGLFLELPGGYTGLCPAKTLMSLQPSSLQDLFPPGQSVVTRLSRIDSEKKRFLGSLRGDTQHDRIETPLLLLRNYLASREDMLNLLFVENTELASYEQIQAGDVVEVVVSSVYKKGILGDLPSGAKALATKDHFGGITPEEGTKHQAVVLFVDPITPCVELTLDPALVKAVHAKKDNIKAVLKPGQVLKADVLLVKPEFLFMGLRGHGSGKFVYVPVRKHMNDVQVNTMYKVGTFTEVVIKEEYRKNVLAVLQMSDPEFKAKQKENINFKHLARHKFKPGACAEAVVRAVHPMQINVTVDGVHGRVHVTEIADDVQEREKPVHRFHPEQVMQVRVIGLRDLKSNSYLPITKSKSTRTLLECSLKLNKAESSSKDRPLELSVGDKVWVYVIRKMSKGKLWVQASLTQQGYVDAFHLSTDTSILNDPSSHFLPGEAYHATVLEISDHEKIRLSLIGCQMEVKLGQDVTAQISSLDPASCLRVKLPGGRLGVVKQKPSALHYVGQYIRCHVESVDKDLFTLSLLEEKEGPKLKVKSRKRKTSISRSDESVTPAKDSAEQKRRNSKKKLVGKKKIGSKGDVEEEGDSGVDAQHFSDSDEEEKTSSTKKRLREDTAKEKLRLSVPGFSWGDQLPEHLTDRSNQDVNEDQDDDDDDVVSDTHRAKKKRKRDQEKLIQEYEKNQLDGNVIPQSANDFERMVLQSPDSSVVWLRYMAYHMELGEHEKCRAVAEKALKTISFREEQEKQNVWLAYLNMETMYGESSDVKKLLARAISYNDPLNIYTKMCEIYVNAGKTEDAEQLYAIMTRKFKKERSVWKSYGQFLFKSGRIQQARNLLQRCLGVLDKNYHVEVITRFANLEFSHGDAERGRTMFENLIASYPGRTDLWSVYVDMVIKTGDVSGARQIMERAVNQKLNTKKLSFLFQKFIKFEESHGTEEQAQRVKDMLVTILES